MGGWLESSWVGEYMQPPRSVRHDGWVDVGMTDWWT